VRKCWLNLSSSRESAIYFSIIETYEDLEPGSCEALEAGTYEDLEPGTCKVLETGNPQSSRI
jgi:hypothetical protein